MHNEPWHWIAKRCYFYLSFFLCMFSQLYFLLYPIVIFQHSIMCELFPEPLFYMLNQEKSGMEDNPGKVVLWNEQGEA